LRQSNADVDDAGAAQDESSKSAAVHESVRALADEVLVQLVNSVRTLFQAEAAKVLVHTMAKPAMLQNVGVDTVFQSEPATATTCPFSEVSGNVKVHGSAHLFWQGDKLVRLTPSSANVCKVLSTDSLHVTVPAEALEGVTSASATVATSMGPRESPCSLARCVVATACTAWGPIARPQRRCATKSEARSVPHGVGRAGSIWREQSHHSNDAP
jgi:hypothetical protein